MSSETTVPFQIRPAAPDDVEELNRFIEPFVTRERLLPRTLEELKDLTKNGFLAIIEGRIVGFAALEIYSTKLGEIRSLAVADGYQGRGIGKALVNACIERARERRVFELMAVTSSEEFFQHCGFDFTLPGEKKALFLQTRDKY